MKKLIIFIILLMVTVTACGNQATEPEAPDDNNVVPPQQEPEDNGGRLPPQPDTGTPQETANDTDVMVAAQVAGFFYDLQLIHGYYDDSIKAMASAGADMKELVWNGGTVKSAGVLTWPAAPGNNASAAIGAMIRQSNGDIFFNLPMQGGSQNIPEEYLNSLPPDGAMAALPGACPAAAKPDVTFTTATGEDVTPALLTDKNIQSIPTDMVTMAQNNPGSLYSTINTIVPMGDRSLATPQGWNNLLWDKLKAMQTPADSLMDYQMWNIGGDIEEQIADMYAEHLESINVPQMVIDAFNGSDKTGWYSSAPPSPEDALARMDIIAEMTGSVSGTVHEQRDFSIPGSGQDPVFGQQTGDGIVTTNHPEIGEMNFEVDILLDRFDEDGRAIGGTVSAVDAANGYTVNIIFQPDGSKKGEVYKDGEMVGQLNMTTDAEKFENYVDVQTNQAVPMPESFGP
jgi:hypothetical protein